jgi:hypothetical protein
MKKLIATLMALTLSLSVMAEPVKRPELTPKQTIFLANAATALAVGWFVVPAATLTGKKEQLCGVLGGEYRPNVPQGEDQCPGGIWLRVLPYLQDAGK